VLSSYPQRDSCFAHRFVRLLQKSCAAMDIGQNACLLLCYIAHTEDAARYSGPVRFWNEQLMTVMGFKSPKQLNDARSKAESAGWLVYERSGNREVGRYWVTVPDAFEGLSDSLIEENRSVNHSAIHSENGTNKERIAERISDGSRNEIGTESGKPSNPIPNPIPDPETQRDAVASSASQSVCAVNSNAPSGNASKRSMPATFQRPTVSEVVAYVVEIGATVDARQFVDFYSSNGWKVGRNPMRDWRATVRQWEARKRNGDGHGKSRAAEREQANADAFAVVIAAANASLAASGCESGE